METYQLQQELTENQELLEIINQKTTKNKSRAKRIKHLWLPYQKWFKTKYKTTDFREPVMLLIRRTGAVDFYEDVTAGQYLFKHSDGEERFIIIEPNKQLKFGFADRKFKGYICSEDEPMPYPVKPDVTVEQVNILQDKALNDLKGWTAKELRAKGSMFWQIGLSIAVVIAAAAFYKTMLG